MKAQRNTVKPLILAFESI